MGRVGGAAEGEGGACDDAANAHRGMEALGCAVSAEEGEPQGARTPSEAPEPGLLILVDSTKIAVCGLRTTRHQTQFPSVGGPLNLTQGAENLTFGFQGGGGVRHDFGERN